MSNFPTDHLQSTDFFPLHCKLLCASGAAYNIDSATGKYKPDIIFSREVNYSNEPVPISADGINACLVGQTAIGIIAAFRGTLPLASNDGWKDWLYNLFVEPERRSGLPGKVHSGFFADLQTIFAGVNDAVKRLGPSTRNPVYVAGHSKGGALAPMAAYLLQQGSNIPVKQVITFAAPKSGDKGFQTGYQSVFKNHIRYENYGDLVPFLPPTDGFISELAWIVSFIPDIGPELSKWISEAAGWNYTPIGSEWYIQKNYVVKLNPPDLTQALDLYANIAETSSTWETALLDAHVLTCGHGYMTGTCPGTVCTHAALPA
jgi:hypothetical protein